MASNNVPFRHVTNNGDVPHCVFKHDSLNGKKYAAPEECRDAWGSYRHVIGDNIKLMDNINRGTVRSSNIIKYPPGRNKETYSSSTTTTTTTAAVAVAPSYKGEIHIRKNTVPLNRNHEKDSARNGTYIPTPLLLNDRTGEHVKKLNASTTCINGKEEKSICSRVSDKINVPANKGSALFKEINAASVISKESAGIGNAGDSACGNGKHIKNSNVIITDCTNSSSTITNSTTANTSSRSSSKKTVKQCIQSGVLVSNNDVNDRNNVYSCTFPNNTHILNTKSTTLPISQNVNYFKQTKYPHVGTEGVGIMNINNIKNDHCIKDIHFIGATKPPISGLPVKKSSMQNIVPRGCGTTKEEKKEYTYAKNNFTDTSSGYNMESKRSATSNISTFVHPPRSPENVSLTNRVKTDNINGFQRSENLRKMISECNETLKKNPKPFIPCTVQKNKEIIKNRPCMISHNNNNTARNEKIHAKVTNQWATTSLQQPCAYAVPVQALKYILPREDLVKRKEIEASMCSMNFHNSLIKPEFGEFRNGNSKPADIPIGNKCKKKQPTEGTQKCTQNITTNDTSTTVNKCKTTVGKTQTQTQKKELSAKVSNTQKIYSTRGGEQPKPFANYIDVDTTIVEENDLLYLCRNKNRSKTNIVLPSTINYCRHEKVIPASKPIMNHATTEEKKVRREREQNSKVLHLNHVIPEETNISKTVYSMYDQHHFTASTNIEPTQGQKSFPHMQEKGNKICKNRDEPKRMYKNTVNKCTQPILGKEESKKNINEMNTAPPKKDANKLLQENVNSSTPAFNLPMCVSQNVSSMNPSSHPDAAKLQKNDGSSGKYKRIVKTENFVENNRNASSKKVTAQMLNYCKPVENSVYNDIKNTTQRDASINRIKLVGPMPTLIPASSEASSRHAIEGTVFLNSKEHVADISFGEGDSRKRNNSLRQLLTHQNTSVNLRSEERDNTCGSASMKKKVLESRMNRRNEHTSNSFCAVIKEKPFATMEKETKNISVKGGQYTTRFVAPSPRTETIGKSGYWTYRPLREEHTAPSEKHCSNNGHPETKCIERVMNPLMKTNPTITAIMARDKGIRTSDTMQSVIQKDQIKEILLGDDSSNRIHNRTLSSRSVCAKTRGDGKTLARCKTMKNVVLNNLNESHEADDVSIGTHSNILTQLESSHAHFFSHQAMNTQQLRTTEEGPVPSRENWTLDTSTKLIDETPVVKKAVIIGCNYFRDKDHRLYGAANDAYVFSRTLVKYFDFCPSDIIFLSDCFPADSYINAEYDLRKEEREESEKRKESCESVPDHLVRKPRDKKNVFSLFNKNDFNVGNTADIKEPDSAKAINWQKKNVDLLTSVVHLNLWPTRTNILKAVNWLVRDSVAGGTYVFFFAGKSIQIDNMSGWEGEGYDEAFLCSDPFNDNNEYNIITAVQLKDLLLSIHSKANMTIVLDCSGCQTILDPAGTENSWSYIKGCKQKGIWPITHPTNKVHKAVYDTSIFNNDNMKKHLCRARFADLIEVDSTSAMIDPLLQCISSPTIPPKAYCLCAATWEQISVEGLFPIFRFARVNQVKKMKIPDFQKKKKKGTNKNKNKQNAAEMKNGKELSVTYNTTTKKKNERKKKNKSFYEKKFDISVNIVKTFFRGSQNGKSNVVEKTKGKWKKKEGSNGSKKKNGATEKVKYNDEEEEDEEEVEEDYDTEKEDYDDDYSSDEEEETDDENDEEEDEIIVSHGVFSYCLIEAIIELKEQELKKNILQNSDAAEFLPMTLKNLITIVQEKIQNVKNKKLKKLNQKPEFTLHPGSNANINNYFIHYSKNIHFQQGNYNFLGYDMSPYLNVMKAWEQINKSTLQQQKSLTLTTSLNKVARSISMSASKNATNTVAPQQMNRVS